jgi:hypothetical protein
VPQHPRQDQNDARIRRARCPAQSFQEHDVRQLFQSWRARRWTPRVGLRDTSCVRLSLFASRPRTDEFSFSASILLHELFCDREDRGPLSSIARCLTSAKCVVNSTYVLWQSSNDLSGIDPFLPFCWSVVGRALVRDHAVKRLWGDLEASNFSKQLAEHCLHFTAGSNKSLGVTIGGESLL